MVDDLMHLLNWQVGPEQRRVPRCRKPIPASLAVEKNLVTVLSVLSTVSYVASIGLKEVRAVRVVAKRKFKSLVQIVPPRDRRLWIILSQGSGFVN
jgi:hypothetical protein